MDGCQKLPLERVARIHHFPDSEHLYQEPVSAKVPLDIESLSQLAEQQVRRVLHHHYPRLPSSNLALSQSHSV